MDLRLKRSWIQYIAQKCDSKFNSLITGWGWDTKYYGGFLVGPLLSWNSLAGETTCLPHICEAWNAIKFYMNLSSFSGPSGMWSITDRMMGEAIIEFHKENDNIYSINTVDGVHHKNCNFIPLDIGDTEILTTYVYKIKCDGVNIGLTLKDRKKWKINKETIFTKSQKRWLEEDDIDFASKIRIIKKDKNIPQKVKYWIRDLYNINLAVCYHKDKCKLCGEEIGSRHFIDGCKNIKTIRGIISKKKIKWNESIVIYVNWLAYCLIKHEKKKLNIANKIVVGKGERMVKNWAWAQEKDK